MKYAVVGSRTFSDYQLLCDVLEELDVTMIISGGAKGADSLAALWANRHGIELLVHPAEWTKYGKRAGFLRNKLIVDDCDEVIAFWDGVSRGTASTIKIAEALNRPVTIIRF